MSLKNEVSIRGLKLIDIGYLFAGSSIIGYIFARILSRLFDAFGKNDARIRLLENLQVDIKKNLDLLGWTPPYTIQDGFLSLRAKNFDFI